MPKPRATATKRQREQAKRDRQLRKAERKANRATEPQDDESQEVVMEGPVETE